MKPDDALRARARETVALLRADKSGTEVVARMEGTTEPLLLPSLALMGRLCRLVSEHEAVQAREGDETLTAGAVADALEADVETLVQATVDDLSAAVRLLGIQRSQRARVMEDVAPRWPWSTSTPAGRALFLWDGGASPRIGWPGELAPVEVARWLHARLAHSKHPATLKDGKATTIDDSPLVKAAVDETWRAAPLLLLEKPKGGALWLWPTAAAHLRAAELRVRAEATRTDSPGLSMPVMTHFIRAGREGLQLRLDKGPNDAKRAEVRDAHGDVVAVVEAETLPAMATFGSLATQRVVRMVLTRAHRAMWIEQRADPTRDFIEGGWEALALEAGIGTGHWAVHAARESVEALSALTLSCPAGKGKVFSHFFHHPRPRQRARVEWTVLGPFAPDYIARELRDHRTARDKWLVPIPLPALLPPLVGRNNEHAAQALLQLLTLRELRVHAEELAAGAGVEITERRWRALAEEAALPAKMIPEVLEAYPRGDGERPAFVQRKDGWRFDLAEAYARERATIVQGATDAANGRKRGLKRTARKREQS